MKPSLNSPRQQLVQIMNRIYYSGLTTLSGGNLSILDDDGSIWITPAGTDKGKLTPADIIRVFPDGSTEGPHAPSSEFPFHRAIYAQRPDVRSVVHAHAPALVSFSIARQIPDTRIIPQANGVCGQVGYAPYALPGSEALGASIAGAFAQGYDAVLLENHGVATVGLSVLEAFQRLETLDFCARTQMFAQRLGTINKLTDEQIALFHQRGTPLPEFTPDAHSSREREIREQLVDLVRRACLRQLMISTEGVASARVDGDTFLITPTAFDRPNIGLDDLVLMRGDQHEAGKQPSRSVATHSLIYRTHPDIHCIITTQSPYATAYAVSGQTMETRTIPESYILLVDVPNIPFIRQEDRSVMISQTLSANHPVLLLQNDCVLTTGKTIMQAFDRLEVAEFTARSLIETSFIGPLVGIGEDDIRDLVRRFLTP